MAFELAEFQRQEGVNRTWEGEEKMMLWNVWELKTPVSQTEPAETGV